MAHEKVTSVKTASPEVALQSNRELTRLPKKCSLGPQRTATVKSLVMVLQKELEVGRVKSSDLEPGNATMQKELETWSKTHVETKAVLATDFSGTCDDLGKKTGECDEFGAKFGELEKELGTLRDAPTAHEEKVQRLEL